MGVFRAGLRHCILSSIENPSQAIEPRRAFITQCDFDVGVLANLQVPAYSVVAAMIALQISKESISRGLSQVNVSSSVFSMLLQKCNQSVMSNNIETLHFALVLALPGVYGCRDGQLPTPTCSRGDVMRIPPSSSRVAVAQRPAADKRAVHRLSARVSAWAAVPHTATRVFGILEIWQTRNRAIISVCGIHPIFPPVPPRDD
jgi:hypothetical protein